MRRRSRIGNRGRSLSEDGQVKSGIVNDHDGRSLLEDGLVKQDEGMVGGKLCGTTVVAIVA